MKFLHIPLGKMQPSRRFGLIKLAGSKAINHDHL